MLASLGGLKVKAKLLLLGAVCTRGGKRSTFAGLVSGEILLEDSVFASKMGAGQLLYVRLQTGMDLKRKERKGKVQTIFSILGLGKRFSFRASTL